ncbi:hypothetical protein [Leifsonia sp. SIMBA_070]|uniref:hypothetical protein n=1 Tax=Leifsonia sp. SIMBA_070 TaxID=3085810 RepID=UPI00397A3DBD
MPRMSIGRTVSAGLAAGAAATTALNAVTYLDMVLRGRPVSTTPERSVEKLADSAGVRIPGDEDTRPNRVSGLGALLGIATGVGVGVALAGTRAMGLRAGPLVTGIATAATAMAASDIPMVRMKITDPRTWSRADWLSDIVPHLAYGLVAALVVRGIEGRDIDRER